jgi:Histidine kinase/Y_Y_Y domain
MLLMHYNPATSKTVTYELEKFVPDKNKKRPDQLNRAIFLKDSVLVFANSGAWIKKKGAHNFSPLLLAAPFTNWVLQDAVLYKNHILYCTSADKLLRWDLQTGKLDSLVYTKPFIKEGNDLFLGVPIADSKGKVWMLNGWNWLTYTDGNKLQPVKMNYQDSTEADDGYFTAMIMDKNGDLWMSKKGDGLIYYSPSKNISKQFKQHDGLVMDHIMAVAEDGDGKIWSAAYNQFSVYNPLLNSFYNFTLPLSANNYAYVNFMTTLQNGNIIASIGGDVVEFFTAKLKQPLVKDKPLISMLTVNGLDSNFYSEKALQLAPYENSLRIKFGMLTDNVLTPYDMLYILEGAEKNWSISTTNFEASYNSLPPGDYTFKVKAVAKDKSWQTSETAFTVEIATPYYKAWWFWMLIMAMLVAIIIMVYRYRIQQQHQVFQLKSKAGSLEKEKTIIQYESLKQQLNPHFLFNSLTSLRSLIKTDSKVAASFLDGMSKIYRYVLKSGAQELVLLQDEIEFVKTFTDLQQVRFGDGLQANIRIDEAVANRYIAPVVLQNMVENAIKHNTTSTDEPLVIEIFSEENHVVIRNNLQRYRIVETSNKSGIASLKKLYSFYTDKQIEIIDDNHFFTVRIPLL